MNEEQLKDLLANFQPSTPSSEALLRTRREAIRELRRRKALARRGMMILAGASFATACLVLALVFPSKPANPDSLQSLAGKLDPLFGPDVEALIQRGNDYQIEVAQGEVPDERMEVELQGRELVRLIVRSGVTLRLVVDGRMRRIEFMETTEGNALVVMDGAVWQGSGHGVLQDLKVEAKLL